MDKDFKQVLDALYDLMAVSDPANQIDPHDPDAVSARHQARLVLRKHKDNLGGAHSVQA